MLRVGWERFARPPPNLYLDELVTKPLGGRVRTMRTYTHRTRHRKEPIPMLRSVYEDECDYPRRPRSPNSHPRPHIGHCLRALRPRNSHRTHTPNKANGNPGFPLSVWLWTLHGRIRRKAGQGQPHLRPGRCQPCCVKRFRPVPSAIPIAGNISNGTLSHTGGESSLLPRPPSAPSPLPRGG